MNSLTRAQWYGLSKETKIRWWIETNFDRKPPSPALLAEALAETERAAASDGSPLLVNGSREPAGD